MNNKSKLVLKCIGGPCQNYNPKDILLNAQGVEIDSLNEESKNYFYLKKDGCTYFGNPSFERVGSLSSSIKEVDGQMQKRCDVVLRGDTGIARSHFMIKYDTKL